MSSFEVLQIPVGNMANFSYIIIDKTSNEAIIVDPSWNLEKLIEKITEKQIIIKYIINTHTHFDHILGNEQMKKITNSKIVQHSASQENYDIAIEEGEIITIGNTKIKILHTPGHSKDSICLVVNNDAVLTGDTLFVGNCGRTDLPGSDPSELYDSLFNKVTKLDENLIVYPGHDYGHKPVSSIGEEKLENYVLKQRTKKEFLKFITGED